MRKRTRNGGQNEDVVVVVEECGNSVWREETCRAGLENSAGTGNGFKGCSSWVEILCPFLFVH